MAEPRVWVDMVTARGWNCRNLSLGEFARWRQRGHARRVEVIGIQLVGDLATPAPPPPMPDDYWLHVRGCDCAYCTWERASPVPHLSFCASQDDTMRGYPVCDCGADYENATRGVTRLDESKGGA